jgi:hypothetical protein
MMDTSLHAFEIPPIIRKPSLESASPWALYLAVALVLLAALEEALRLRHRLPAIKGPVGYPIFGNLLQLRPDPSEQLRRWGEKYGGVYQIMMGNTPVVVFNSMQAARDVFIGQGAALVDRPTFYTFHGVMTSVASTIGTTVW